MSHVRSSSDGKILTIYLTDAKIVDELVIRQVLDELLLTLNATRERMVVLDFRDVEFFSSSALGMLIRVHKRCMKLKMSLKLSNLVPEVENVFKVTGVDQLFDIVPSDPRDLPGEGGVFAKLKPRPSGGAAARDPDSEGE